MHSEKLYKSALLPPTYHLRLVRGVGGWQVSGKKGKPMSLIVTQAIKELRSSAAAKDLPLKDVMVKQGLSWGGDDVARVAPGEVFRYINDKLLPKVPMKAKAVTILLQAKIDLVSELKWVILDGKLRGRGWRSYHQPGRGESVVSVGQKSEEDSRAAMKELGLANDDVAILKLEESMRNKVKQVLAEATADANGEVPQYLRVDLLLDKQGRTWLGERESWGADLIENTYNEKTKKYTQMNPAKNEVATAIVSRALRLIAGRKARKTGLQKRGSLKRRLCTSPRQVSKMHLQELRISRKKGGLKRKATTSGFDQKGRDGSCERSRKCIRR